MSRSIREIQAELAEAQQAAHAEREAKKAATPVLREFTITPHEARGFSEEVWDTNCCLYELRARVSNKEEAKAAEHSEHDFREGGVTYVFNKLSGKIVCATGGGTIWVSSGWKDDGKESARAAMDAISKLLVENPAGGDITEIVEAHRNRETGK